MSKVLGFTKNGGLDWFISAPYGNKEIQGIPDPDGGHALNAPTAIPSPFARMDLVRKSFENIVGNPELRFLEQGRRVVVSKEDEKLVSHCLDLAEILFFYENYKSNISIIPWDRVSQVNALKNSREIGHRRLGEALDLYLRQDEHTFNFAEMRCIYLIKYNHQVIGGTSPLTLFFSAAVDTSLLGLKSNKGTTYFSDIVPLYDRDEKFQRYLYLLFKKNTELGSKMKAFQEYLKISLRVLKNINHQLYMDLNALNLSELDEKYADLNTNNAGQVVEVLGVSMKTIDPNEIIKLVRNSDFIIHSAKYRMANKPLVLQNNFNKPLRYVNAPWDSTIQVPYNDPNPLSLRKPPGQDITYPYLTFSDFLEPYIIRLVYPVNADKYFDGDLKWGNQDDTKGYLLPLKPGFFEYFDVADLVDGGIGKPSITLDETAAATSVRVQLRIPIAGGSEFIVFERIYHRDGTADEKTNKGAIREHQFGMTIFPFLRFRPEVQPFYHVHLIDRDVTGLFADASYQLNFFTNESLQPIAPELKRHRNKKVKNDPSRVGSEFYSLQSNFDYIQVDNHFAKGIIIPKWKTPVNNGGQYTFALDFGTTNTHIEYTYNNGQAKAFDISREEIQAVPLTNDQIEHNFSGTGAIDIRTTILKEFVPEVIGGASVYRFPHRTVIGQSKSLAPIYGGRALIDFNIPMLFEKGIDNSSKFFTGLKWDNQEPNNDFRVRAFLEELILLIRNKVVINGGDLQLTKVIWTYPTSMSPGRKANLQYHWTDLFHRYISADNEPVDICESIAPYYYFRGSSQLQGLGYGVSVLMDIGGGTSDVVVYENKTPKLISSYKFAGNTLFGDGYKELTNIALNDLINKFKPEFDETLTLQSTTLKSISDKIYAEQRSSDYNAFLFSLVQNPEVTERETLDYSQKIAADKNLKIIFLYFYAAKVYHIAKLMKAEELGVPMNLIFSGNGAKMLKLLSPDHKLIADLTKEIFNGVYGQATYPATGLKINVEREFPKEVTCKGALAHEMQGVQEIDLPKLKKVYTGLEDVGIRAFANADVDDRLQEKIVADVQTFNAFFIALNKKIDFDQYFDVAPAAFERFKVIVNQHTKAFLNAGIDYNQRLDGANPQPEALVTDTLFFYPLVEIIQQLFKELSTLPKH